MAVFDEILNDIDNRFNLNGKAPVLLTNLLTVMIDRQSGSLAGFLELFHRAGLANVAETWVSSGANTALSRQQLEDALGSELLGKLASRSGLSKESAIPTLAYMIPLTVDQLTPNGSLPSADALQALVSRYLSVEKSVASTVTTSQNARSAVSSENAVTKSNEQVLANAQNNRDSNSLLRLLLPLLLFGLLAFIGYRFCTAPNQQVTFPNANKTALSNVNAVNKSTTNTSVRR